MAPSTAREIVAAALYHSSTEGSTDVMSWSQMIATHGEDDEGVSRFYRRADAVLNALMAAGYVVAQLPTTRQRGQPHEHVHTAVP
jgi:hypothetical protein